jgi:hypothetical protein
MQRNFTFIIIIIIIIIIIMMTKSPTCVIGRFDKVVTT